MAKARFLEPIRADWRRFLLNWPLAKNRLSHYAGLLSFLGTAFVVLTFITRDIYRDNAKDLVASLETTQNVLLLKMSLDGLYERQETLLDRIKSVGVSQSPSAQSSLERMRGEIENLKDDIFAYEGYLRRETDTVKLIYEHLPETIRKQTSLMVEASFGTLGGLAP